MCRWPPSPIAIGGGGACEQRSTTTVLLSVEETLEALGTSERRRSTARPAPEAWPRAD